MKKLRLFGGASLGAILLLLLTGASVPDDKKVIELSHMKGKKGPVTFEHAKHANEYKKSGGATIVCKDCHHTLEGDEPAKGAKVQTCRSCHVKEGEAKKKHEGKEAPFYAASKKGKIDRKSIIMHQSCVDGCHKKVEKEIKKKISTCKTCHKSGDDDDDE